MFFVGCFNKTKQGDSVVEDVKAKELFQGLWVSDDNGEPALLAKGDSVFFPDSGSIPVRFWIYKDSFYLKGQSKNGYKIKKQSENLFPLLIIMAKKCVLLRVGDKNLRASIQLYMYML